MLTKYEEHTAETLGRLLARVETLEVYAETEGVGPKVRECINSLVDAKREHDIFINVWMNKGDAA